MHLYATKKIIHMEMSAKKNLVRDTIIQEILSSNIILYNKFGRGLIANEYTRNRLPLVSGVQLKFVKSWKALPQMQF